MAGYMVKEVPANRSHDLSARRESGTLTTLEKLAEAVLRGNGADDQARMMILDAAIEEYAHGTYRVPVRVIADFKACIFVVRTPFKLSPTVKSRIVSSLMQLIEVGAPEVIVMDSGMCLEVYEVAGKSDGPTVEISEGHRA